MDQQTENLAEEFTQAPSGLVMISLGLEKFIPPKGTVSVSSTGDGIPNGVNVLKYNPRDTNLKRQEARAIIKQCIFDSLTTTWIVVKSVALKNGLNTEIVRVLLHELANEGRIECRKSEGKGLALQFRKPPKTNRRPPKVDTSVAGMLIAATGGNQ